MSSEPKPPTPADFLSIYIHAVRKVSRDGDISLVDQALIELRELGTAAKIGFDLGIIAYHLGAIAFTSNRGSQRQTNAIEILSFGYTSSEHLAVSELDDISRLVSDLVTSLAKLNRTPLVALLRLRGIIANGDPLACFPEGSDEAFGPLLGVFPDTPKDPYLLQLLETLQLVKSHAQQYQRISEPLVDYHLWRLCGYIRKTTGAWCDRLVVDLLAPLRIRHCGSADELKQWRYARGNRRKRAAKP